MRWEIIDNTPKPGQTRTLTKFAWFPTRVMNKLTHTDYIIWLEMYIEEQQYERIGLTYDDDGKPYFAWRTVQKTIHV